MGCTEMKRLLNRRSGIERTQAVMRERKASAPICSQCGEQCAAQNERKIERGLFWCGSCGHYPPLNGVAQNTFGAGYDSR